VYAPEGQATMSFGSNQVTFRDVSCTDADPAPWSVHRYCELLGTPRPGPVASVCDPTP
jgi:hypothetical protein